MKKYSFATKILVFIITIVLSIPIIQNYTDITANAAAATTVYTQNFEDNASGWYAAYGGTVSRTTSLKYGGSYSLKYTGRSASWHSPAINIYNAIKSGGEGFYNISMVVRVSNVGNSSCHTRLIIRGTGENSFIKLQGSNYYYSVTTPIDLTAGTWCYLGGNLCVREEDIQASSGTFNLMLDVLECADNQVVYIDNVNIKKINTNDLEFSITPSGRTMAIGQKQAFIGSYASGVTYRISNTNIATVDSTGVVTAVSGGKTRLEICRTTTGQCEYAFVVVTGWHSLSNGTYYITNVGQERYMQSNNNSANKLELWNFDNGNDQKWYLTYISSGGYYKITRNNDNNYALTAVDYDLLTQTDVKLQAYSNLESQHWYIQPLSNDKYKIWTESAENGKMYLSARNGNDMNGIDVLLSESTGDDIEQWYLHKAGGNEVF